jgi:thiol-disulfide isomerase/thioredoxin
VLHLLVIVLLFRLRKMPSHQEPAPGSKSSKFVAANPLDPMLNPFSEDQQDAQKELSDNVNSRVQKAMEDLKEKHRTGTNEIDDPDRAPTGLPYQQARLGQQQAEAARRQQKLANEKAREEEVAEVHAVRRKVAENLEHSESDDPDSDYDDLMDNDPVLEMIRQKRLEEIRTAQIKHAENVAKGHGQYRTISQDEFLPECTGSSEFVAVHFFHDEFERCKIMDHHLKIVATQHTTCKFLRIDAQKTPFFVSKLQVRTLPTLIVFRDGKALDRLTGFDGLSPVDPKDPDKWYTRSLQTWLAETGAIEYVPSADELREDIERLGLRCKQQGSVYRGGVASFDEEY